MTTSERWIKAIETACSEPNPARSNHLITTLHYDLSEALASRLGRAGGPNFHSWAVWGSRKAGVTIRQEDLDSAIVNAAATASVVGCLIGGMAGVLVGRALGWKPDLLTAATGMVLGVPAGGWTGRRIAIWSRAKAARLMLRGNQIVMLDIGKQSARFLELIDDGATVDGRTAFFAGLRSGPSEKHGQDRLAQAFRCYLAAFDSPDLATKRAAMIEGNCEIVYHEHIRLNPYIRGAMPFIIRRCVTRRHMSYQVGERNLTVGEHLPGISSRTAARNWTNIDERMRYVFALFREFHDAPEIFSRPKGEGEVETENSVNEAPERRVDAVSGSMG